MHSEMVQLLGEFLGTFILILLGNGVVSGVDLNKTKATGAGWVAITLGWGFAVMMGVYISGFMSPAHLNPAVTIAMAMIGSFRLEFGSSLYYCANAWCNGSQHYPLPNVLPSLC